MIIIVITIILNLYKSKRKKYYGEVLVPILQFLINDKNKYQNGDNQMMILIMTPNKISNI